MHYEISIELIINAALPLIMEKCHYYLGFARIIITDHTLVLLIYLPYIIMNYSMFVNKIILYYMLIRVRALKIKKRIFYL